MIEKPTLKPKRPFFSSGPTAKHPLWSRERLDLSLLGRSHRSVEGKAFLKKLLEQTAQILEIPSSYKIAMVPGSATGAMEMLLWTLLGQRPVDVFAYDVFGHQWLADIRDHLYIPHHAYTADFGSLPNFSSYCSHHDCVVTWNGTTSGTMIPNSSWISDKREGLVICDATSAAFAIPLPWGSLDATAFSWQKGLGGEAAHGMIVLSPQAIERLKSYTPSWPIPKLFRFFSQDTFLEGLFEGETLNTPSLLVAADCWDALEWTQEIGGSNALYQKTQKNFEIVWNWTERTPWVNPMALKKEWASHTSFCLVPKESWVERSHLLTLGQLLKTEGVAYDIVNHKAAPSSLRLWTGPTIEAEDLLALLSWIDWGFSEISKSR